MKWHTQSFLYSRSLLSRGEDFTRALFSLEEGHFPHLAPLVFLFHLPPLRGRKHSQEGFEGIPTAGRETFVKITARPQDTGSLKSRFSQMIEYFPLLHTLPLLQQGFGRTVIPAERTVGQIFSKEQQSGKPRVWNGDQTGTLGEYESSLNHLAPTTTADINPI